jgi:hypothetical protein
MLRDHVAAQFQTLAWPPSSALHGTAGKGARNKSTMLP